VRRILEQRRGRGIPSILRVVTLSTGEVMIVFRGISSGQVMKSVLLLQLTLVSLMCSPLSFNIQRADESNLSAHSLAG